MTPMRHSPTISSRTFARVFNSSKSLWTLLQGDASAVIFGISFDARDPALAAKVVNDLVDYVLNKNKRLREDQAEITRAFFDGEVTRLGESQRD